MLTTIFSSLSIFVVQLTPLLPSFPTARAWCCPVPWLHRILPLVRMRKGEVEGVPNDYAAGEDYTITITSSVSGGLAHVFAASDGSIVSGGSYAMSASTGDCRGQDSRATSTEYVVWCVVLCCAVLCCGVLCCGVLRCVVLFVPGTLRAKECRLKGDANRTSGCNVCTLPKSSAMMLLPVGCICWVYPSALFSWFARTFPV